MNLRGEWVAAKRVAGLLASAALMCGLYGCATMVSGTKQTVRFDSIPQGATAEVRGAGSVVTPGQMELARQNSYDVEFNKSGYLAAHSYIGQSTNPAVFGNILLGGLIIGVLVDYSTGAAYDLDPAKVSATLVPQPKTAGEPAAPPDKQPPSRQR